MRIKFLLSLTFLAPMMVMAETLSPEAALQRALSDSQVRKTISTSATPRLLYTEASVNSAEPAAYVFSRGNDGFMVLSADDVALPILGYSDTNSFDPDNIPANMKSWLDFYADEIAWARENGVATYSAGAQSTSSTDRTAIAPLLTTTWYQLSPYNTLLPEVDGTNVVTGCVATAMAQIMNYHKYPTEACTGSATATVNDTITYTMDFSEVVFDWDNMLDSYDDSATQEQKDAVGLLMKACGFGVNMNYGTSSSSALQVFAGAALMNYFGYDKGITSLNRDVYTLSDWNDLIYEQLAKKQPVQYGGGTADGTGGHSFVCDGYSGDNYFHINWGWGGVSDGYFLLSALDPTAQGTGGSSTGSGYNTGQKAIINICKPCGTTEAVAFLYADSFDISSSTVALGSSFSSTLTTLSNSSYVSPIKGTLGVAFINQSTEEETDCASQTTVNIGTGYHYNSDISVDCTAPTTLTEGTYDVVPVFCLGTGDEATYEWKEIRVDIGFDKYIATVSGNSISFSTLSPSLSVTEVQADTLYQTISSKIKLTVTNTGTSTFYDTIKVALCTESTTTAEYTGATLNIEVAPGETKNVDYYITVPETVDAGTYDIIVLDGDDDIIPTEGTNEAIVADKPTITLEFGELKIEGSQTEADPKNLYFSMPVTCTSFRFSGYFVLFFFPYTSGDLTSIGYLISPTVSISAGESADIVFSGAVSALEYNSNYVGWVNYGGNWVSNYVIFGTKTDTGIEDVEVDADVVAEEYYNLQGIRVAGTPGAGHYIKVTTYADGHRTSQHVVLK